LTVQRQEPSAPSQLRYHDSLHAAERAAQPTPISMRMKKVESRNGSARHEVLSTERYHVPNLERALVILEYLAEHPGAGISEIAEALKFPKNSVFRIVSTLHAHGYLRRDPATKHFALGTKLLALGYAAVQEGHLVERSMDVMRQVRDQTNETVCVGIRDGLSGIVLEDMLSHQQVKVFVGVGTRFPLHTAAPGKAILSRLPQEEREDIVQRLELTRFNENTITSRKVLLEHLEIARQRGYAVDNCEHDLGIRCVGAAILNHHNYPVGALWVTGPSYRFSDTDFDRVGQIVRTGALAISTRFGYEPSSESAVGKNGKA